MSKGKTLSDRLASLTSVAPSECFDPDAPEFDDGTGGGLSRYDDDDGDDVTFSGDRPSADLRVAADMESIGQEYHGKRVSRKSLQTVSGMVGDPRDPEASDGGSSMDDEGAQGLEETDQGALMTSLNLDDVSSSEDDSDDEETAFADDGDIHDDAEVRQGSVFAGVRGKDVDAAVEKQMMQLDKEDESARRRVGVAGQGELKRAREALRQREWWDSLLEVRILLQRLMNAANKLPGPNELPLFLNSDESLKDLATEGAGAAQGLANKLSAVRRSHMACWGVKANDGAGPAVVSEDDDGDEPGTTIVDDRLDEGPGAGDVAATEHGSCMGWWEGVLGRWHEKTQLVDPGLQKKFRVVNQGPWAQVKASLADRDRANRRAFMTEAETDEFLGRKLAKRLKAGQTPNGGADGSAREGVERDIEDDEVEDALGRGRRKEHADRLDLEVLDDRDLYQHLLKEFMDVSGGGGGGGYGAAGSIPVRRKSRKKIVDRRASKGRKIKYVTHPKMQNFMFPQEYGPAPMEPSELFSSLLGGAGKAQ